MKKVNSINYLNNARNAEHYQLYSSMSEQITEELATKYGLTTFRNRFLTAFAKENAVYAVTRGYIQTTTITEKETEANQRFRAFDLTVQSKELSTDASIAAAAKQLVYAMNPYKGVVSKPQTEKLGMMKDLVDKLEKEYAAEVTAAGVTELLADLKQAVAEFDAVLYERANEQRARKEGDSMTDVRPEVESSFDDLANLITALYLVATYIDIDNEKSAELGELIDQLNARILQYHNTLSRRGVGSIEEGEEGTTPDEGEEPTPDDTENPDGTENPDDTEEPNPDEEENPSGPGIPNP